MVTFHSYVSLPEGIRESLKLILVYIPFFRRQQGTSPFFPWRGFQRPCEVRTEDAQARLFNWPRQSVQKKNTRYP